MTVVGYAWYQYQLMLVRGQNLLCGIVSINFMLTCPDVKLLIRKKKNFSILPPLPPSSMTSEAEWADINAKGQYVLEEVADKLSKFDVCYAFLISCGKGFSGWCRNSVLFYIVLMENCKRDRGGKGEGEG